MWVDEILNICCCFYMYNTKMKILPTLRTLGTLCFVVEFIVIVLVWQSSSMADPESAGGCLTTPGKPQVTIGFLRKSDTDPLQNRGPVASRGWSVRFYVKYVGPNVIGTPWRNCLNSCMTLLRKGQRESRFYFICILCYVGVYILCLFPTVPWVGL